MRGTRLLLLCRITYIEESRRLVGRRSEIGCDDDTAWSDHAAFDE